jgi:ABC-three component (ABC-3C) system Middle Component 3
MLPWRERAVEERRGLNPALVTQVIRAGVSGHEQEADLGLPYALTFPLVGVVLHADTRAALPRAVATSLPAWIGGHALLRYELAPRTSSFAPLVREGILLGLRSGALSLAEARLSSATPAQLTSRRPELDDLTRAAYKVGRWFARVDSPTTVLTLLGIRL